METIVSIATAPMKSAIGMIRLSGDTALEIIKPFFSNYQKIKPRMAIFGDFHDADGNIIDEVVLIYYQAPKSYTGEDMIEITTHGSIYILNTIVSLCIGKGARLAERGEYTLRAFYHNKLDLVQAESIVSLIDAKTDEQRKLSLFALKGKVSKTLDPLKNLLADLLANIEVNIDYPEYEDIEVVNKEKIEEVTTFALKEVESLLKKAKHANEYIHGIDVAIVGKPNVGKSSLLNALLGENKAIVTDIPGTTRDVVEGEINLDGMLFRFHDTAGIHESSDVIESVGIKKANEIMEKVDLIIFLKDAREQDDLENQEIFKMIQDKPHIEVYNKMDLNPKCPNGVKISAKNGEIDELVKALKERYQLENTLEPSLCSSREIGYLEKMKEDLLSAQKEVKEDLPIDLIEVHLKDAYDALRRILGETPSLDLQEEVFSRFCVGK